jgi:WS/DGAT/MGAT family acyltransferase
MERIGSLDAVFLGIETSSSPMNIGSVGIFEGPAPSDEAVHAFVASKLRLVPRCRQRVRETRRNLARPVWIDDRGFDLRDHLRRASLRTEPGLTLEQFVAQVMVPPLDRRRALWEMWIVEGLEEGRWAIVSKTHHCMVDGIAGTDLLSAMMDHSPSAQAPPPEPWVAAPEPSPVDIARMRVELAARGAWRLVHRFADMAVHARRTWSGFRDFVVGARGLWLQPSRRGSPLTGPIGPQRRWIRTKVSLGDAKVIRDAFGGTVNDVVLAAIAHGFRELLVGRGEPVDQRTVMALVPVSMRGLTEHGLLDNRVAVTHALLPVGVSDSVAGLIAVHQHMHALKESHETEASTVLLHTGDYTPHALASAVARGVVRAQQNLETIATNVPGPRRPLYLCGREMIEAYPFSPIAGHIRIAIAIWSYCGTLSIGVTGDRDTTSDLDVLVRGIDRGFERLLVAAASTAR